MSAPTELALKSLKRVGRFYEGHKRLVLRFNFEEEPSQIDAYVDSDYAGCPRTRKSTLGGCIMRGTHLIRSWSSTQKNAISLSSGEAELYAMVKGVGTGIGIQQLMTDLNVEGGLRVHTDSSAAKGICKRVGLGTQRHIAVNSLWVQEKLRRREFALFKVNGEDNPTDLFTKHIVRENMHKCLHFMSAEFREGRPSAAPQRKYYEKILGEDMEWQTADAVREEFDDDEAELRLAEESRSESAIQDREELLSMEEPWAANDGFTDTTLAPTPFEDGSMVRRYHGCSVVVSTVLITPH